MAAVDPAAKVQQFEAALTNLATELGSAGMKDAMSVLDAATAGLNKLGDWAHNNPDLGRIAFDAGAGLAAVATALGTLSTAILVFGPALRLLGLGGGATAGVSAGRAIAGATAGSAGIGIPLAVAGLAAVAIADAATDPHYGEKAKARDLAAGRASAEAAKAAPQSSTFVPQDGYGVDGRPIQMKGDINVDGKKLGSFVANGLTGPNTGTTGVDLRTGFSGSMASP